MAELEKNNNVEEMENSVDKVEEYGNESIRALKGADRVRLRPEVMLGSRGDSGAFHTFQEILGNAIDEVQAGCCDKVEVHYLENGGISVEDFGRGVPMAWNATEKKFNWHLIFNDLYAGGKYDENAYKSALGLNGVGACATQYTSEYMEVRSIRDGKVYEMSFKKGFPVGELRERENTENLHTGTYIEWKPDEEVFGKYSITYKRIYDYCEGQAHISKIIFEMYNDKTGEHTEIVGEGIKHMLLEAMGEHATIIAEDTEKVEGDIAGGKHYKAEGEFVIAVNDIEKPYNTTEMTGGVHSQAYEAALATFFRGVAKEKNWGKIHETDYKPYISFITSTHSTTTSFANQTKNYVNDAFIYDLIFKKVVSMLEGLHNRNNEYLAKIYKTVEINIEARIKAKELQDTIKAAGKLSAKGGKKKEPEKFCGCREKDATKRELYIVEGDSALLACKTSRNADFQALIPIRGKTLNCLKVDKKKALTSQVISDLVMTIGTGVDLVGDEHSTFNIDNLQFDKIIFCTDADVDGYQIRVLLYTIFYSLMPRLLLDGHVYVVESPLFEIETSGKSYFAYTIEERDKITAELASKGIKVTKINRSKGLGENDPEMMAYTTMSPETRRLTQLKINTKEPIVKAITEMLFGEDEGNMRKSFILDALSKWYNVDEENALIENDTAVVADA